MGAHMVFVLKTSLIPGAGVGVFATSDIPKDTVLHELFSEDSRNLSRDEFAKLNVADEVKTKFSIHDDNIWWVPHNFNKLCIGWYLNHSDTPNLARDEKYNYHTLVEIANGSELTIDYNDL